MTRISRAFGIATLVAMLAACGGGSDGTATSGNNNGTSDNGNGGNDTGAPTTPTIEGVATPSSVSVVTATNAN